MKKNLVLLFLTASSVCFGQNLKISQLPVATTPLSGTELIPLVQNGVTKQTTIGAIGVSAPCCGLITGNPTVSGNLYVGTPFSKRRYWHKQRGNGRRQRHRTNIGFK